MSNPKKESLKCRVCEKVVDVVGLMEVAEIDRILEKNSITKPIKKSGSYWGVRGTTKFNSKSKKETYNKLYDYLKERISLK